MNTSNPLELAKQGNAEAIAALMNKSLQAKGITVSATTSDGCLTLVAEAEKTPDKTFLVDFIRKGLTNVNPKSINRVVLQGKTSGQKHAIWREFFDLDSSKSTVATLPKASTGGDGSKFRKINHLLSSLKGVQETVNTALLSGIFLALLFNGLSLNRSKDLHWEYRVEGIEDASFDYTMQQRGAEGWEVASARRAVSGEGDLSQGLYEIVFKRQITGAQAANNLRYLELISRESEGKLYVSTINFSQRSYYLENGYLASTLTDLDLGFDIDTENYVVSVSLESPDRSVVTASAKTNDIKSFTGVVAVTGGLTKTIVCETNTPSKTPPVSPQLDGSEFQCPSGSSEP